jgi:hypothetical protein
MARLRRRVGVQITSIPVTAGLEKASRGLKYIKPQNNDEEKS